MRVRALLVAGVAVAASLTTIADAATPVKKSCNLVTDGKGDVDKTAAGTGVAVFPDDSTMDVLGGDLASDATKITAQIKLAAAPTGAQPLYERRYVMEFKPAGSKHLLLLAALVNQAGLASYSFGYYGVNPLTGSEGYNYPGTATGKIDGSNLHITASLADMAANENVGPVARSAKIGSLRTTSYRRVNLGVQGRLFLADDATSKATYLAGSPSCLKVG